MGAIVRTKVEIDAEIKKLEELKPKIKDKNYFGDSNHEAIGQQIDVLRNGMSEGDCYDNPDIAENEVLLEEAINAVLWLEGDDEKLPSKSWEELIQ